LTHGGRAPQVKAAAEVRVQERLTAMLPKALQRMEELLDSELDAIRLAIVRDILDRLGYKPSQKVELNATTTVSTMDIALRYMPRERLDLILQWQDEALEAAEKDKAIPTLEATEVPALPAPNPEKPEKP
jgi:hypothetical protein